MDPGKFEASIFSGTGGDRVNNNLPYFTLENGTGRLNRLWRFFIAPRCRKMFGSNYPAVGLAPGSTAGFSRATMKSVGVLVHTSLASEAVRLERLDDAINQINVLLKCYGHLDFGIHGLPNVWESEDEFE